MTTVALILLALVAGFYILEYRVWHAQQGTGPAVINQVQNFDPTRPIRTFLKAWHSLSRKAGLTGLRCHDLRHHAITELAESGASEQTIMAIAGQAARKMLARYSHICMQAKRAAIKALPDNSYGTNCDTNAEGVQVFTDRSSIETIDAEGKKKRGRDRAPVATPLQVQNRMVEILRMCAVCIGKHNAAPCQKPQIKAR